MGLKQLFYLSAMAAAGLTLTGQAVYAQNRNEGIMEGNKTLVAYFSATGTTEKAAEMIAEATGGDIFRIEPQQAYTAKDLDWTDKSSRSSIEMKDSKSRPAIAGKLENAGSYGTIYLGYPIWWDLAPRIINTFLETYGFEGKTVIPFATSGGSGITNSENELKKAYPSIDWKKGKLLNRATNAMIEEWVK